MEAEYATGDAVTAMDRTGCWLEGRIIAERGDGAARELKIHFFGWSKVHDEWLKAATWSATETAAWAAALAATTAWAAVLKVTGAA